MQNYVTCKIIKGFSYLNIFFSYLQRFQTQISIFKFSSNCLLCCLLLSPESSQIILGTKSYTGSNILKGNCSFNSVEVSDQLGATSICVPSIFFTKYIYWVNGIIFHYIVSWRQKLTLGPEYIGICSPFFTSKTEEKHILDGCCTVVL